MSNDPQTEVVRLLDGAYRATPGLRDMMTIYQEANAVYQAALEVMQPKVVIVTTDRTNAYQPV